MSAPQHREAVAVLVRVVVVRCGHRHRDEAAVLALAGPVVRQHVGVRGDAAPRARAACPASTMLGEHRRLLELGRLGHDLLGRALATRGRAAGTGVAGAAAVVTTTVGEEHRAGGCGTGTQQQVPAAHAGRWSLLELMPYLFRVGATRRWMAPATRCLPAVPARSRTATVANLDIFTRNGSSCAPSHVANRQRFELERPDSDNFGNFCHRQSRLSPCLAPAAAAFKCCAPPGLSQK